MKLKFTFLILFLSSHFLFSQEVVADPNKDYLPGTSVLEDENGKTENSVYTCNRFDWKIKIPENYIITRVKNSTGVAASKALPNGTAAKPYTPHLISFQVDSRNTFVASFESLAGSTITSLEAHKDFMVKLLNDTYSSIPTLKFDLNSSTMKIGKYDFYKVETRLYDYKTGELLLTQDLYNSFIDNHLFSVNINFNNPNIGRLLTDNFMSSLPN